MKEHFFRLLQDIKEFFQENIGSLEILAVFEFPASFFPCMVCQFKNGKISPPATSEGSPC
jgi:hypothetical protein